MMIPDSGYFYMPYVPLTQTPVVLDNTARGQNGASGRVTFTYHATQDLTDDIQDEFYQEIIRDLRNNAGTGGAGGAGGQMEYIEFDWHEDGF